MEDHRSTTPSPQADKEERNSSDSAASTPVNDFRRGVRFWCIIAGLSVTSLQTSLEHSVVVTAGPAIVNDLAMEEEYIWITNAFFLCWYVSLGNRIA
jgi:hypothetical protein